MNHRTKSYIELLSDDGHPVVGLDRVSVSGRLDLRVDGLDHRHLCRQARVIVHRPRSRPLGLSVRPVIVMAHDVVASMHEKNPMLVMKHARQ